MLRRAYICLPPGARGRIRGGRLLDPGLMMRDLSQQLVSAGRRLRRRGLGALLWTAMVLRCGAAVEGAAPGPALPAVEFNAQIRPILADNCYLCHGPDRGTRKAGLRLDDREACSRA